ncbi:MAG TPA: PPOX class F420-dependent oxidoreductase [Acidimicrobiales bacterium]|nr:PPOX class F420-dependent oxidoreductase [Acidimicrobiales bacterium]
MAAPMNDDARRAFLSEGTRTGKLATTMQDGSPHVTPIWFVLDGDDIVFTTHESSLKGKALLRDGRVSMVVDDQAPPYSFVMVKGTAVVSRDLDDLVAWATKIGGRYMGAERAAEFGQRNGVDGELLVRITPTKTVALANVSGY